MRALDICATLILASAACFMLYFAFALLYLAGGWHAVGVVVLIISAILWLAARGK